jgi:hypothetical protein
VHYFVVALYERCIITISIFSWFSQNLMTFNFQLFSTSKECVDFFNEKRCIDGKGLVLPSQIVSAFFLC